MAVDAGPEGYRVRDCAREITDAMERHVGDHDEIRSAVAGALTKLTTRDDLERLGIPRQGNNVASSQYLYFDGDLSIILFEVPKDKTIPPHDHGVWEAFCVYRGCVRHQVYRRADDASRDGYAELELLEDRKMMTGDVSIVAPPADIHGFCAQQAGTLGLTVMAGSYKPVRGYYQPETNSYVIKTAANSR